MSKAYDAVVFGTLALDLMWRMARLPELGTYEPILEEKRMIGGEAANSAIALWKWGAKVALLGTSLGEDSDGELLKRLFQSELAGFDTTYLTSLPNCRTPFCACLATPDGNRTMIGLGFETMQVPSLNQEIAQSAKYFTTDPNAWEAGKLSLLNAEKWDMKVVSMDYSDDAEVCDASEIILTSHAHLKIESAAKEYSRFARELRDRHDANVIVTWGERGCFVAEKGIAGDALHIPAYVAPKVVDTTGAGDIFRAGLIFGRIKGWDMTESVRFACAAAALNCVELGAWAGVRSLEETLEFQKKAARHANHLP